MKRQLNLFLLLTILLVSLSGCNKKNSDDVVPTPIDKVEIDEKFISSTLDFSVEIFKTSWDGETNTLISPTSIMVVLAMTANGANDETLAQMEMVLGRDIPLVELNKYLHSYLNALPSEEKVQFLFANSIWIKDCDLSINDDFLQLNTDYYSADIFKVAFDDGTVKEVNTWVDKNTNGMIQELVKEFSPATVLVLINAITFEAEWAVPYTIDSIRKNAEFTTISGSKEKVEMMHSKERLYLENDKVTGFMKPYANEDYYFVALLPKEGVDISDYIAQISGQEITELLGNQEIIEVSVSIPKFSYSFDIQLKDILVDMGMSDAFSEGVADFSKMVDSEDYNFFVSEVIHKTYINVDEVGTKAGAVTGVIMETTSAPMDSKVVVLDRPFVYMIVDKYTNLPIFIGVVTSIQP